ncbi:MAG: helix-turn-helix domain-containing protein, partial [Bilophila sp.]
PLAGQGACEALFADLPTLEDLQRRYIRHVLRLTNGRITGKRGALRTLGMKRSTLYLRLKRYGIRL